MQCSALMLCSLTLTHNHSPQKRTMDLHDLPDRLFANTVPYLQGMRVIYLMLTGWPAKPGQASVGGGGGAAAAADTYDRKSESKSKVKQSKGTVAKPIAHE